MFRKQGAPFEADDYFNIYVGCNVGCTFCKFNEKAVEPEENILEPEKYANKKVLVSYSTEPLPFLENKHTEDVIKKLHEKNASIMFLTRHPQRLTKILDCFSSKDIVGVSVSEGANNNVEMIHKVLTKAKNMGLKTWLSVEPIVTFEFADYVVGEFKDSADYLRLGKLDGKNFSQTDWEEIGKKIKEKYKQKNVFVKNCD